MPWDLRLYNVDVTLSPAVVNANTTREQAFAVPGVRVDSVVVGVNKPTSQVGLGIVGARVSAENEISIVFGNFTGAAITPTAAESYSFALVTKQP